MVGEPEDARGAERTAREPGNGRQDDYADVGVRVAGVLNAAEDAAEQIRTEARRTAEDLHRQAEAEARAYASQRRQDADREAHRVISEAQAHAQAIRESAQAILQQAEEDGRKRREQFRAEARSLERRVGRALDGLRDVTSQLQDVLLDAGPANGPEAETASRPERPWLRLGRGGRRTSVPEPSGEATAELERALMGVDTQPREARVERPEEAVYDSLKESVEKVGDRWVPKRGPSVRPRPAAPRGASNGEREGADGVSNRGDLYERARELGIRGRARMSKDELASAVAAAEAARSPGS